jgi:hypothetical protein
MKKFLFLGFPFLLACNTIYTNQDASQRNGGGTNPNDPSSICAPVDRVRIVLFPSVLAVNSNAPIDATPKDPFGNNRPDVCNEKDGIRWSTNNKCTVPVPTDFRTNVRGIDSGTCELTATVAGKSDTIKFEIQ